MSARALDGFLAEQVQRAKSEGVLFSVHLKATMMKAALMPSRTSASSCSAPERIEARPSLADRPAAAS
jgi:hypothetical protein